MTTIIFIEHDNGVTVGYDSLTSYGNHVFEGEAHKVFAVNGVIYGAAGAVLDSSILRHADLPNAASAGWDVDRWVSATLIPALIRVLGEHQALEVKQSKAEAGASFLIAVNGRVYDVCWDWSVLRRADHRYAIGSGSQFARGALEAGATVREALGVAAKLDGGTGGELHVLQDKELLG